MGAQRPPQTRTGALDRGWTGRHFDEGIELMIELTRVDEFAVITLNRVDALNALSFASVAELGRTLDQVGQSDARALLMVGAGSKAFCAGADIKELQGRSLAAQKRGAEAGQATFARLERL